jgi:hypothetical protein
MDIKTARQRALNDLQTAENERKAYSMRECNPMSELEQSVLNAAVEYVRRLRAEADTDNAWSECSCNLKPGCEHKQAWDRSMGARIEALTRLEGLTELLISEIPDATRTTPSVGIVGSRWGLND